jgi:hypothetical protein
MADIGGERVTDTFRYNHHAIPVPKITATDRILDATARLTVAIEGVQEAPPDELATIQALRTNQHLHQSLHRAPPLTRNMWKSETLTKSNIPHATQVQIHLRVHRPADETCQPSSKMNPTTKLHPRHSSAVPPVRTPYRRPPPHTHTSTHAPRT